MKKVFMTVAVVAMMIAVADCGNNASKKAAEATEEAVEACEAAADSCAAAVDSTAAAVEQVVEEATK